MNKNDILFVVNKIKAEIDLQIKREKYNKALLLISSCANILYSSNIYYYDEKLERNLYDISNKIIKKNIYGKNNADCIIFYDGFGLDFRGLAQIYLKALCNSGKNVIYITYKKYRNRIPDLLEIINKNNGQVIFIDSKKETDKILQLNDIVMNLKPGHFFFYSYPSDVVATTLLYAHEGDFIRYQINLTDHTFWLGAEAIDYCIEFRDYGAAISKGKRNIPENKIVKLPFYPICNDTVFQGYPFKIDENKQRVVFSGGSLYKTLGDNNRYYEIIRYILNKYSDVIFWYAGTGDRTEMDKLIHEFPQRVFLTEERSDLIQVLKHSYLYLSTYPICGGLMFQYAAIAQKVPLTLSFGNITDGFLINQSALGIEFDNINDYYIELDKLMTNKDYLYEKGKMVSEALITEKEFENRLFAIMNQESWLFSISNININYDKIHKEYLQNYDYFLLCNDIAAKHKMIFFKLFPVKFIIGILYKIRRKVHILRNI